LAEIVEPLADAVREAVTTGHLFVFGHSLGAMVGWQLVHLLERHGYPVHGFVPAACPPPHAVGPDAEQVRELDGEALVAHLRDMDGLPQEVLEDPELLSFVLDIVRSDFAITRDYPCRGIDQKLSCPVLALGGGDDRSVAADAIARWSETTAGQAGYRMLAGGHFFHLDHPVPVAALLVELCQRREGRPEAAHRVAP